MPRTFNPGHRPSQPLYPDELVYTTVDKIVEFLQLPEPEPVALTDATSVSGNNIRIPISGADYRRWGYAAGDTITVYDDVNALGATYVIGSIQSFGSGGSIWLLAPNDGNTFSKTNNGVVQASNILSNSKQRGITKANVENLIKKKQDYIDQVTRSAWRPRIVVDEYKNFTTFKPYRRRYYTDYVGAVYLNHRNIMQILRMGVWQGDYYRELAAGRIKLKVADKSKFDDNTKIFLCPNVAHVATLQSCATGATSTTKWIRDFGAKSIADEIAGLINEDADTSKGAIQIGTLTQNGKNLNVSNEYLATANSDDGDGVICISSMRAGEDGINSTIAVTERTALTHDKGTLVNAKIATLTGNPVTSFTVDNADGFVEGSGLVFIESGTDENKCALITRSGTTFTVNSDLNGNFDQSLNVGDTIYQLRFKTDVSDEERQKDWWAIEDNGAVLFNNQYPFFENHSLKVSYIYGQRYVDKTIEDVATKMVVKDILMSDDYTALFPEGTQNLGLDSKIQKIEEEVKRMLIPYQETIVVAGVGG
tara:strand:- start:1562 stop:3169 length:1608 start_codon:yes stop_codon:yes gene_type:complete